MINNLYLFTMLLIFVFAYDNFIPHLVAFGAFGVRSSPIFEMRMRFPTTMLTGRMEFFFVSNFALIVVGGIFYI